MHICRVYFWLLPSYPRPNPTRRCEVGPAGCRHSKAAPTFLKRCSLRKKRPRKLLHAWLSPTYAVSLLGGGFCRLLAGPVWVRSPSPELGLVQLLPWLFLLLLCPKEVCKQDALFTFHLCRGEKMERKDLWALSISTYTGREGRDSTSLPGVSFSRSLPAS